MLKNSDKTNFFNGKTEGWYRNISLLPVPRTDSLNSLAEALHTKGNVNKKCILHRLSRTICTITHTL